MKWPKFDFDLRFMKKVKPLTHEERLREELYQKARREAWQEYRKELITRIKEGLLYNQPPFWHINVPTEAPMHSFKERLAICLDRLRQGVFYQRHAPLELFVGYGHINARVQLTPGGQYKTVVDMPVSHMSSRADQLEEFINQFEAWLDGEEAKERQKRHECASACADTILTMEDGIRTRTYHLVKINEVIK